MLTDEDRAFVGLAKDYLHRAVNHSAGEYVRLGGWVHTNTIESVWAQKHLKRYVAEMTYRWNKRSATVTERMNDLFARVDGPMPYKVLVA